MRKAVKGAFDETAIRRAARQVPTPDELGSIANVFSALNDQTRLAIIFALSSSELCVSDLATAVHKDLTNVSMHLRLLRGFGVVAKRADGRMTFYSLKERIYRDLARRAARHTHHSHGKKVPDESRPVSQ